MNAIIIIGDLGCGHDVQRHYFQKKSAQSGYSRLLGMLLLLIVNILEMHGILIFSYRYAQHAVF